MDSVVVDTSGIGILEGLGVAGASGVLKYVGRKDFGASVVDTVDTVSISGVELVDSIVVSVVGLSVLRTGLCDVHNNDCVFLSPLSSVAHV